MTKNESSRASPYRKAHSCVRSSVDVCYVEEWRKKKHVPLNYLEINNTSLLIEWNYFWPIKGEKAIRFNWMPLHNNAKLAMHFNSIHAFCSQKFEKKYQRELGEKQKVSHQTQFEYAWCLVRSNFPSDIKKVKLTGWHCNYDFTECCWICLIDRASYCWKN